MGKHLVENIKEMFSRYYIDSDIIIMFNILLCGCKFKHFPICVYEDIFPRRLLENLEEMFPHY